MFDIIAWIAIGSLTGFAYGAITFLQAPTEADLVKSFDCHCADQQAGVIVRKSLGRGDA